MAGLLRGRATTHLERLFPSVCPSMSLEVAQVGKSMATHFTLEWPFTSVNTDVRLQVVRLVKDFTTELAVIYLC